MGNVLAVDADKRKELIRQRKKNGSRGLKAGLLLYGLFMGADLAVLAVPMAFMLRQVMAAGRQGYGEDMSALITLLALSPIPGLLFWLIPLGIKNYVYGRLLWPAAVYRKETVWIHRNTLEHGYYSIREGSSYWTRSVRYCDIQRLEYRRREGYLRIYAPTEDREWSNPSRMRCYSGSRSDEPGETFLAINSYFEGFWDMVELLEEKSGVRLCET